MLVAFSDLHDSAKFVSAFVKEYSDTKATFLFAGDLGKNPEFIRNFFEIVKEFKGNGSNFYVVPGNTDGELFVDLSIKLKVNIDMKRVETEEVELKRARINLVGIGGAVTHFSRFNILNNHVEEDFLKAMDLVDSNSLILSHQPPFGYFDTNLFGEKIGSRSILEVLKRKSPAAIICGHVHEQKGVQEVIFGDSKQPTQIIKLPPAKEGFVAEVNNGKVDFKNLL